jgi:hypothetical protein
MAAERKPIRGVHTRIAAAEAGEEAGVQMNEADDVEPVVLERPLE